MSQSPAGRKEAAQHGRAGGETAGDTISGTFDIVAAAAAASSGGVR